MKESWKRFWGLFSVRGSWSRGRKAFTYVAFLVLAVALIACICRPSVCPAPTPTTPTPTPTLPTKVEVEEALPEMWYRGISWDLMLSRIKEKFPETNTRAEFSQGAKFMVLTVKEGDFFVAPGHKLIPWPPA